MIRRTITLALVTALLAVPTTAFALEEAPTSDTTRTTASADTRDPVAPRIFEEAKARALATIDKQQAALATLASKVADSRFITDDHAATLRTDIGNAGSGLQELARQISDATTWNELRPLIAGIDDWKIAQVLAPKTAQVIASDGLVAGSRRLESFSGVLANVIGRFETAGFDVVEAQRLLAEMNDLIAEGYRLASPVAADVIGLQAADWPDPAAGTLAAGRSDLHEAGAALRDARGTGVDIVGFLRGLVDRQADGATDA
jgi:hypothetical protein